MIEDIVDEVLGIVHEFCGDVTGSMGDNGLREFKETLGKCLDNFRYDTLRYQEPEVFI